jgi:hypothetical protein
MVRRRYVVGDPVLGTNYLLYWVAAFLLVSSLVPDSKKRQPAKRNSKHETPCRN